ncbi:MAG: RsmB/NOP family class I SAM-dependent RNA methyltransferase, partial [Candidatus Kapaibacteriota bacterium]
MHLRFLEFSSFVTKNLLDKNIKLDIETNKANLFSTLFINNVLYPDNLISIASTIEKLYSVSNGLEHLKKSIIDQTKKIFSFDKIQNLLLNIDEKYKTLKGLFKNTDEQKLRYEISKRLSIPDFVLESWSMFYPQIGINPYELAESLLYASQFTVRVNNPKFSREGIIAEFGKIGYQSYPTKFSPYGITFRERVNIMQHPYYRNRVVEIQDEGSQLICLACNPQKNQKILDACAGAGGKSLFFAFLMEDAGTIIANDVSLPKLNELRNRARKAGFQSIKTNLLTIKERKTSLLKENSFNIVLVDAPCSGIGTSRRNPMHKWWLSTKKLHRLTLKQYEMLKFYSQFVRPNGYLVYATCSLMPEENQFVAEKFLCENNKFTPEPLSPAFNAYNIDLPNLDPSSHQINLLPHIHSTDGFYIAKFKKTT